MKGRIYSLCEAGVCCAGSPIGQVAVVGLLLVLLAMPGCSRSSARPSPTAPAPTSPGIDTKPGIDTASIRVDDITVLVLESYPAQVHLRVRGTLADTCHAVEGIAQARAGNDVVVTITTAAGSGCTGTPHAVSLDVRLDGGFPSGRYRAIVNGVSLAFTI